MKLLISTVDPLAAGATSGAVVVVVGLAGAGGLAAPPFELDPHAVAITETAANATKTKSARPGRSEAARAARTSIVRIAALENR